MKTPHEILLIRHRSAEPKLDAIRRRLIATQTGQQHEQESWLNGLTESCREFFRVPRVAWLGLAAAWLVIVALNIASFETPRTMETIANTPAKRSPEMMQALREQKRLFTELVGAAGEKTEAEAPRFVPRPRSERSPRNIVA